MTINMFSVTISLSFFFTAIFVLTFQQIVAKNGPDVRNTMQFCADEESKEYRLNSTVLKTVKAMMGMDCVSECILEPCCRSVNYHKQQHDCEFLHDMKYNSSNKLVKNIMYNHLSLLEPRREYKTSCLPNDAKKDFKKGETKPMKFTSCKQAFENNSSFHNGQYTLQLSESSEPFPAYCHMTKLGKCGDGGWTLVLKIDGDKTTFQYYSSFWTNKTTYQVQNGLNGLTEEETKSASYWNTPFTKICVGMKVNDVTNWVKVDFSACSLYDVIAGGQSAPINIGRANWLSLIPGANLQENCNREGFNLVSERRKMLVRLGIFGNNENDCKSPDSAVGFGIRRGQHELPCGSLGFHNRNSAFGLILIQ